MISSQVSLLTPILLALSIFTTSSTQQASRTGYVTGVDDNGDAIWLLDSRQPSLYTSNFGDCLESGSSKINVTRFDAAYYKDNMTVLFHLQGNTNVKNESLMMHINVFAYGESHLDLLFNPCNANINSLCPMNRSVPIEANGIIPIAPSDVAGIPPIALSIPDFEGQVILRIFANSTRQEIGCYSGVLSNGVSLSHPEAVGSILGLLTFVAVIASFATAIYGDRVSTMRTHYAHSLSVFVVFAVFQHIYFTGALSLNWPSVLVAFWSNFAWAGGMIYGSQMQNSISRFVKNAAVNGSHSVSSGGSGDSLNGGVALSKIYGRALSNATSSSPWYGRRVDAGLPLPGNFSGFAGTLAASNIPASNAFMTGFLWILITIFTVVMLMSMLKFCLELLTRMGRMKKDSLMYFRTHWVRYIAQAVLRVCFIAFFMMMVLTTYQFTIKGSQPIAVAVLVFLLFFCGLISLAGIACYYRLRLGHYQIERDELLFSQRKKLRVIPWIGAVRRSTLDKQETSIKSFSSMPWRKVRYINHDPTQVTVHNDTGFIEKFGWLAARFRRTRWWFFAPWLVYEFIRACFYGGGTESPLTQAVGLLIVEIIAMILLIKYKPFEAARLNALVVYLLAISKIATAGLSIAFHPMFNLGRIITTVLGIIIVLIQSVLTLCLAVAILVGATTSWFSIRRAVPTADFRPRGMRSRREKYLVCIDEKALDLPPPPPTEKDSEPKEPLAPPPPCFTVSSVRRCPKIHDEDAAFMGSVRGDVGASKLSLHPNSSSLAFGGVLSRASSEGDLSVRSAGQYGAWGGPSAPWLSGPYGGHHTRNGSWSSQQYNSFTEGLVEDYQRHSSASSLAPLTRGTGGFLGSYSSLSSLQAVAAVRQMPHSHESGRHAREESWPIR